MSRQERNALRKEKETLRQARQSAYMRDLMNDIDGRPEEVYIRFLSLSQVWVLCRSAKWF